MPSRTPPLLPPPLRSITLSVSSPSSLFSSLAPLPIFLSRVRAVEHRPTTSRAYIHLRLRRLYVHSQQLMRLYVSLATTKSHARYNNVLWYNASPFASREYFNTGYNKAREIILYYHHLTNHYPWLVPPLFAPPFWKDRTSHVYITRICFTYVCHYMNVLAHSCTR